MERVHNYEHGALDNYTMHDEIVKKKKNYKNNLITLKNDLHLKRFAVYIHYIINVFNIRIEFDFDPIYRLRNFDNMQIIYVVIRCNETGIILDVQQCNVYYSAARHNGPGHRM